MIWPNRRLATTGGAPTGLQSVLPIKNQVSRLRMATMAAARSGLC